ncbi:MAG: Holliday junction DNA helicase RuvA [Planctomycetota bacterium]|nr:Holliday junction DNA helicase RuvA [Planctomycetota bacterium]
MIRRVRGILRSVVGEELRLAIGPIEIEVLVPEFVRRRAQLALDEPIELETILYIEGGMMGARMEPRLVGFMSAIDREFFETYCSVDGVGVRKALRSLVVPTRDFARMIQDQDVKMLATFPGIGEATAERIVAKLRRKVGKFALMVSPRGEPAAHGASESNGAETPAESEVIRDTYAALLSVGHTESHARQLIDQALAGKKKFKSAAELIDAIYQQRRASNDED